MKKVLIVDDEKNHRLMMKLHLTDEGYDCIEATDGLVAYNEIIENKPDIILLDITMDIMDGFALLKKIRLENINTPVVIVTAHTDVKTAVSAMKLGATDFVTKPVDIKALIQTVKKLLELKNVNTQFNNIDYMFDGVYQSKAMQEIIDLLSMVAPTDATVLILGESGTGKELIAKSIHKNSKRKDKPFVPVNCAALNDNLIESELFGHIKGSFTGASSNRQGRFAQASGGTIFLDELSEIPLATQTKLLRVIQEKVFEPVGSDKPIKADVRIIAASNKNIEEMVNLGTFRQDLYFRLCVFPITLPPLRERPKDIPLLINYFIDKYAKDFGKNITSIDKEYIKMLENYDFKGNIRELENIVERSLILTRNNILTVDTLPNLQKSTDTNIKNYEKQAIIDALQKSDGNKTNAAKLLGISRRSLYYKIEEFNISD